MKSKNNTRPIYILDNVPGAPIGSPRWESICHQPRFLVIRHNPYCNTSRWNFVERKRPFLVQDSRFLDTYASSKTLAGAMKAALRLQKELA